MAAGTYLFGWIKSWRNPILNGELLTQSKMGPNSKSKFANTSPRAMAAMTAARGRLQQLSTLLILLVLD